MFKKLKAISPNTPLDLEKYNSREMANPHDWDYCNKN